MSEQKELREQVKEILIQFKMDLVNIAVQHTNPLSLPSEHTAYNKAIDQILSLLPEQKMMGEEDIISLYLKRENLTDCRDNADFQDQLEWIEDFAHALAGHIPAREERKENKCSTCQKALAECNNKFSLHDMSSCTFYQPKPATEEIGKLPELKRDGFREELRSAINRNSKENGSDTPDFILAEYLETCLKAFDEAMSKRTQYYNR